jgi:hypothetical protein
LASWGEIHGSSMTGEPLAYPSDKSPTLRQRNRD